MSEPDFDSEEGQLLARRRFMLETWNNPDKFDRLNVRIHSARYIIALENFIERHYREGWLRNDPGLRHWRVERRTAELFNELSSH